MIRSKMQVFIQLPAETSRRVLHAAEVDSFDDGVVVMQLGCGAPTIESGAELLVYYETNHEFMKLSARVIEAVERSQDDEDVLELKLEIIGRPVSAEGRKCFRVVTALCGLTATIGDQSDCRLVDASITGFAVIAKPGLKVGTNLRVTLRYEDASFSGNACLQSIKQLDAKRTRYGFSCSDSDSSELARGLRTINIQVQRTQMQRVSGAA